MSEAGKNEKIGLCARRQPLVCTQLVCDRKSQTGKTSSEALTSHFTNQFPDIPGGFALQSCTDTLTGGNTNALDLIPLSAVYAYRLITQCGSHVDYKMRVPHISLFFRFSAIKEQVAYGLVTSPLMDHMPGCQY